MATSCRGISGPRSSARSGRRSIRSAISRSSSDARSTTKRCTPVAGLASSSSSTSRSSAPASREYFADARTPRSTHRGGQQQRRRLDRAPPRPARSPRGPDAIVAANGDTGRAKPRPDLYLDALVRLELEPDEAIAFEDSPNGVTAAKAAGLFCIAVPNPITATLALDHADLVLESLADLPLPELIGRFDAAPAR